MFRQKITSFFAPSTTGVVEGARRFRKLICVISIVVLIVCMCCIPVSAETTVTNFADVFTLFDAHISALQVPLHYDSEPVNDQTDWKNITADKGASLSGDVLTLNITGDEGYGMWEIYRVTATFSLNPKYQYEYFYDGFFKITITDSNYQKYRFVEQWNLSPREILCINEKQNCTGNIDWYYYSQLHCYFSNPKEDTLNRIKCTFYITNKMTMYAGEYFHINFSKLNLTFMDKDEQIVEKVIQNQNENTNKIIQNQKENTDKITQNQNENTQAIIDNQNQLAENEKNEANSTGDSGVSDVTSAIPDYSGSLIETFKKLVTPMVHENTDCVIEFSGIKIPKINGFFNSEIVLMPKQEIYVEKYVGMIPISIINIVRALLTIVLFIFCYKEFYGIIEYIMTLRSGK